MAKVFKIDGLLYINSKFHANDHSFYAHATHFDAATKHREYAKRIIESTKKINGVPVLIQYNRNMGVINIHPRVAAVYDKYQGQDIRLCAGKIVRDTIEALKEA